MEETKAGAEVLPQGDEELNGLIAVQKKKAAKGTAVMVAGLVLLLISGLFFFFIGIVISVIVVCIGLAMRRNAKWDIKHYMAQASLIPALEEVFDHVTYYQDGHISEDVIKNTDMGFGFRIDEISGSDHITAEYKGVQVELSDITLTTVKVTASEDGENKTRKVHFRGMWLICDFHKQFSADLLLRERDGIVDKNRKNGIQTENEAFNKQFYIKSENEHDVFYILTPHMMEYIQRMDAKAGGRTYMRFLKEGKLILALDTGRDAFEVGNVRKADAKALREQFISEVRYVTELIDELRLVKTLYKE